MIDQKIKVYLGGGAGIEKPIDFNGNEIKEGDILTHCYFDCDYIEFFKTHIKITDEAEIERRVHLPAVKVFYNHEGKFFYGEGIERPTYMHDFRFKYAKIIKPE